MDDRPYQIDPPTDDEKAFMEYVGISHNSACRSYRFGRQPQGKCDCGARGRMLQALFLAAACNYGSPAEPSRTDGKENEG